MNDRKPDEIARVRLAELRAMIKDMAASAASADAEIAKLSAALAAKV